MSDENKTHWKKLVNPDYLGSYSLTPGQDMILTIDRIVQEKVPDQKGKKKDCTVCHFKEPVKPMIMNRINQKTITQIYATPYIEDWVGKKIQLFSSQVDAFGEMVDALRIRANIPKTGKPDLVPGSPTIQKVIAHLKTGGLMTDIEAKYTLSDIARREIENAIK